MKLKDLNFSSFELVVLTAFSAMVLGALAYSGVMLMAGLFIGLGSVFGVGIVIHKFPWIRRFILKYDRWFDLGLLILGFVIARGPEGFVGAVFAATGVSGYLIIAKKIYGEANEVKPAECGN